VIDEFIELLHRQCRAAGRLEARLRALELIVTSNEHRLLRAAVEEVEAAAESLAGLELARTLVVSALGLPVDVAARDMIGGPGTVADGRLTSAVDELCHQVDRLREAQHRAHGVLRERAPASSLPQHADGGLVTGWIGSSAAQARCC